MYHSHPSARFTAGGPLPGAARAHAFARARQQRALAWLAALLWLCACGSTKSVRDAGTAGAASVDGALPAAVASGKDGAAPARDNDATSVLPAGDAGASSAPAQGASAEPPRDAGARDAGPRLPARSAGCGKDATGSANFQMRTLRVGDRDRVYFVRLPAAYDRNRAYPLYFGFHNSGGTGAMGGVDLAEFGGDDAIFVSPTAIEPNRTFPEQLPAELALFDALRERMQSDFCIDRDRQYSVGMSAGAEMTNFLSCKRGDSLRATGALSGRISPGNEDDILKDCVATPPTFLYHAVDDDVADVSASRTLVSARIKALGCTGADAFDKNGDCRVYRGCSKPLTYCEPAKGGHGGGLTREYRERMWKFISIP